MKNIILISIDNLRYDCIGYQPDKRELKKYDVLKYLETPTLDSLAEKSLCFTQCISTNTYTTAAHASVLTGLYPPRHGVREFYGKKLSSNVYTLAEILKVYGYKTVMFTDTPQHFKTTDLARGFDYVFSEDENRLFELLNTNIYDKNSKNFIFVHFFDVHEPYLASENDKYNDGYFLQSMEELYEKYGIPFSKSIFSESNKYFVWNNLIDYVGRKIDIFFPLYIQGIRRFDLGRFRDFINALEYRGCMDDSLIIIFSDHGEGRKDDKASDSFGHAGSLYDNVIRVPLMLYHKDIRAGVIDKLISIVDIFPTILDFAIKKNLQELLPYNVDGMNLIEDQNDRRVYSETWIMDCTDKHWNLDMASSLLYQRALRTESYKYIVYGIPERFDGTDINNTSDADFLRDCYRCLLCEFESYDEFFEKLSALKRKLIKREDLITTNNMKSYCYYDLKKDPLELNPVFLSAISLTDIYEHFQEILEISRKTSDAENIFDELDRDFLKEIARRLFLMENEDILHTLSLNKHLLNELIDKIIMDNLLSDEEFIKKMYKVFLNRMPADVEQKEATELLHSGVTRRRYFNKRFFENKSFINTCKENYSYEDVYSKLVELDEYKKRYKELTGSLIFKFFNKTTYLLDYVIFPEGTKRGYLFSRLLKKLR